MHTFPLFHYSRVVTDRALDFEAGFASCFPALTLQPHSPDRLPDPVILGAASASAGQIGVLSCLKPLSVTVIPRTEALTLAVQIRGRAYGESVALAPARVSDIQWLNVHEELALHADSRVSWIVIDLEKDAATFRAEMARLRCGQDDSIPCQVFSGMVIDMVRGVHFARDHAHAELAVEGFFDRLQQLLDPQIKPEEVSETSSRPSTDSRLKGVRRAVEFINANPQWEFDAAELADIALSSARTFYHYFKQQTGLTPYQYYLNVHLKLARLAILSQGDKDVALAEIAVAAGFYHLSRFSRSYYRCFGELPSETQRRVQALHKS